MSDPSGSEDELVPEADRLEQALDASPASEPGLSTVLGSGLSTDDEVPEADALEQASTIADDDESDRW